MPRIAGRNDHTADSLNAQGSKLDLRMPSRLRPYRWPLLCAAVIAACLLASSPNFRYASGPQASPYAGDFLQEWVGGWIVQSGDRDRLYDLPYAYRLQHDPALVGFAWNDDQYLPLVYPPFYYALVSPLSWLSVRSAAWIWAAAMLTALVASCWIMNREFSRRRHDDSTSEHIDKLLPWMLPASLVFMPVIESLSSSQKGTLCLLLFTATLALWQRGRNFSAGMVFGLLAFKPQLTLVIALAALWKRDWRFVAGGFSTGVVLAALSLLVSVDASQAYVRFALGAGDMQTTGYDLWKSHTVWGFGKLLAPHDARLARFIALALTGAVGYFVVRIAGGTGGRWDATQPLFRLQFAGLLTASVLLSPHLFTYDLAVLLLPMAIVLHAALVNQHCAREKRLAVALTLLLFAMPAISTGVAARFGVQLTVPLLLGYLALIARLAKIYSSRCGVQNSRRSAVTLGSMDVGEVPLTLPSP